MEYSEGYVYELMDNGGPTDNREPYFKEADVPDHAVVGGVPAKVIKYLNPSEQKE